MNFQPAARHRPGKNSRRVSRALDLIQGRIEMTNYTADTSQRKAARIAGLLFLFSLMIPLLNWTLVLSKFIVAENAIDTARYPINQYVRI